ncbi:Ankyrin repeat protein [Rickettsiales bacterium Ac37b]|nr:Ankyrin repeat protein [Rickettsiales bacterium Ac37b]
MKILRLLRNVIILAIFLYSDIGLMAQQLSNTPAITNQENTLSSNEQNINNISASPSSPSLNGSNSKVLKSSSQDSPIKYNTTDFTPWNNNINIGSLVNDHNTNTEKSAADSSKKVEQKTPDEKVVDQKTSDKKTNTSDNTQSNQTKVQNSLPEIKETAPKVFKQTNPSVKKIVSEDKTKIRKDSEEFLKQEISSVLADDTNIPYDIAPIYYDDQSLTDEQRKQLKNKVKHIVTNSENANFINKLLKINYKVAKSYDASLISANNKDNRHLSEPIQSDSYKDMAFESIVRGDLNGIRALINNNYISINTKNKHGETLLIYSTLMEQVDVVRLLLAKGANVNDIDAEGSTALHIAVVKGYYDIANALIVMGANPSIRNYIGNTPLDYAIKKGDTSLIQLLS